MFFLKRERGIHLPKGVHKHPRKPSNYTLSRSRVLDGRYCAVSMGLNLVSVSTWKCKKLSMPSHLALALGNHFCCLGIVAAATPTKLPNQTSSKLPRLLSLKIWKYTWSWWGHFYSQLSFKGHLSKTESSTSWWYMVGHTFLLTNCYKADTHGKWTPSISPNSVEGLGKSWI